VTDKDSSKETRMQSAVVLAARLNTPSLETNQIAHAKETISLLCQRAM
jgi:hypothetical protein